MKVAFSLATLVATAGLACSAMAQDSVSKNGTGLPGDSLDPWGNAANQEANFAVDLVPIYTSCGDRFGIAPLVKTSKTNGAFFGSLWSAQGISQTLLRDLAAPARTSYSEWSFSPGFGVNPTQNFAGTPVVPISWTFYGFNQFGAALSEFSTDGGGANNNNIISAIVNFAPERPGHLYVSRVVAAVNEHSNGNGKNAAFGLGAVDGAGHVYFRADGNASPGPNPFTSNQIFRIDSAARTPTSINSLSALGPTDAAATDWIVVNSATTYNTPSCLPSDLATLPDGSLMGSNFDKNFVYETALNTTTSTAAHRAGTADHRGGITFSQVNLFGGVGTASIIGKSTAANGDPADRVCIWGVNANATVGTQYTLTVPASFDDNCDSYTFGADGWDNYRSQVAFNGGNGQIALGKDQAGRGLMCGFVTSNRSSTVNPWDALAVCRFDTSNPVGTATWALAAWTDTPGTSGKPIKGDFGTDGAPFTGDAGEFDGVCDALDGDIGRLASFSELGVAGVVGPSISCPVFDSVGNVWFISSVALKKYSTTTQTYFTDFDSALIRATYNPDTFCYDLELVLELGDTFDGTNSGVTWQVQFLDIADSNSVSSGTMYSQNGMQAAWNNLDPTSLLDDNFEPTTRDTRALGGLVLAAKIVYDVDFDGDFEDPTSSGGNPNSIDEAYNALLYIGNTSKGCPSDFNGDGFVNGDDFDGFVAAFEAGDLASDFDGNFFPNGEDFDAFVDAFISGC